jgi:hypothetical protein
LHSIHGVNKFKNRVVLNIFIAILEEAYVISKMENKSHWVYDYLHQAGTKHQKVENIVVIDKPEEHKVVKPEKEYSRSVKNDLFKKRHVTFDQAKSYGFESEFLDTKQQSMINLENKKKDALHKAIENEFNTIDNTLDEIRKLSLKTIASNASELDELRTNVFDQISNIDNRTFTLREFLSKTIN